MRRGFIPLTPKPMSLETEFGSMVWRWKEASDTCIEIRRKGDRHHFLIFVKGDPFDRPSIVIDETRVEELVRMLHTAAGFVNDYWEEIVEDARIKSTEILPE